MTTTAASSAGSTDTMSAEVVTDESWATIDAIAHSVITYGYSTQSVNGVEGSSGKGLTTVTGPGGGIAAGEGSAGGGGLREGHADHVGDRE